MPAGTAAPQTAPPSGRSRDNGTIELVRFLSNPLTLNATAEQAAGILRYWREE